MKLPEHNGPTVAVSGEAVRLELVDAGVLLDAAAARELALKLLRAAAQVERATLKRKRQEEQR
jgi:hypothetical protein